MPEVGRGLAYLLCSLETCSLSRAGSWQPSKLVPAEMAQHLWLWERGLMWFPLLRWISPVAILGQKALRGAGGGGLILQKRKQQGGIGIPWGGIHLS